MKDYKGMYHNGKTITPCYEYGAHFKYSDLVNSLLELQTNLSNKNDKNDIENQETNYSPIKNDILLIKEKINRPKQYNLKTYLFLRKKMDNQRYNEIDYKYNNENEDFETNNNNNLLNKESNKNSFHLRKKLKNISKSINKKEEKLPKINIFNSNSISLRDKPFNSNKLMEKIIYDFENDKTNTNNYEIKTIKEYTSKNKRYNNNIYNEIIDYNKNKKNYDNIEFLPHINSFNSNHHITQENENKKLYLNEFEKTKSQIFGKNKNKITIKSINKSHKGLSKKFLNEINSKENLIEKTETHKSKKIKIKSIFETEKQIKNNNLLTDRKNIYKRNNLETINNDMTKQIYILKKNLLNNSNK